MGISVVVVTEALTQYA